METIFYNFLNALIGIITAIFNLLFSWLPSDPLKAVIDNWDVVSSSSATAIRWLNWFVDIPFASTVLSGFVSVFLLFAAWTVILMIVDFIYKGVETANPVG